MDTLRYEDIEDIMKQLMYIGKSSKDVFCQRQKDLISPQQFYLLKHISNDQSINQKQVAKKLNITPATLSVRIDKLEKQGLLIRKIDENDKRNYVLELTDQGSELVKSSESRIKNNVISLFHGLTLDDIAYMKQCYGKMIDNINRMKEELDVKD